MGALCRPPPPACGQDDDDVVRQARCERLRGSFPGPVMPSSARLFLAAKHPSSGFAPDAKARAPTLPRSLALLHPALRLTPPTTSQTTRPTSPLLPPTTRTLCLPTFCRSLCRPTRQRELSQALDRAVVLQLLAPGPGREAARGSLSPSPAAGSWGPGCMSSLDSSV